MGGVMASTENGSNRRGFGKFLQLIMVSDIWSSFSEATVFPGILPTGLWSSPTTEVVSAEQLARHPIPPPCSNPQARGWERSDASNWRRNKRGKTIIRVRGRVRWEITLSTGLMLSIGIRLGLMLCLWIWSPVMWVEKYGALKGDCWWGCSAYTVRYDAGWSYERRL